MFLSNFQPITYNIQIKKGAVGKANRALFCWTTSFYDTSELGTWPQWRSWEDPIFDKIRRSHATPEG